MRPKASWAINSEAMRARGIIVKYPYSYHYTARVNRNSCEVSLVSLEESSHFYCMNVALFDHSNAISSAVVSAGTYQWFSENDGKITFYC